MRVGLYVLVFLGVMTSGLAAHQAPADPGIHRAKSHTVHLPRPHIVPHLIPFGPQRKRQMAAYSGRHYGERTWQLKRPRVIVEHWAETGTAAAVYNTFAPNVRDPELHELPNV
jgi:hypothetical protein